MCHINLCRMRAGIVLLSALVMTVSCGPREQARAAEEKPKSLEQLRHEYAMGFLDPAPHMALARYFSDHGNPLQAFYILETARRGRFKEDEFDEAFRTHFLGIKPLDKSPGAEAALLAELTREPEGHEPLLKLADIHIARENYAKAKEYLAKLIALRPDHFDDTEALAEVLRREGKTEEGEKLLREWAQKHPETSDGYRIRASGFPEKEAEKAKALLTEAIDKYPGEAAFYFDLAGIHLRAGRYGEAEPLYVKAAELAPDSSHVQTWVGRFFFKAMKDERRAFDYYLKAYLLDPHAYETEFVESRIPAISGRAAEARLKEQLKQGVPLTKMLEDPNPVMVQMALEEMHKKWEPAYLQNVIDMMAHDDGGVRWLATATLTAKIDRSFDEKLKELLQDKDLRRRGLALYIAAGLWGEESFDRMRKALQEEAQLLRFDAVSALILQGNAEGRKLVADHARREAHPRLKNLIEETLKRDAEKKPE